SFSSILAMADMDVDDLMDEMFGEFDDTIEDMEDFEIDFYIYQNALAAIEAEVEDEKISLQFQGGDYRAQNILLESDEFTSAIKGKIDGNKETMTVEVDDEEVFAYEFDSKSGDLTLTVNDGYDEYELEGINIKSEDDEVVISLDEFAPEDSEIEINGTITIKKAAKIKEMSGDEFDIGSADEDELEEVINEESEAFEELGLY
ncbi:MAG: hypothetical protein K5888_03915, partial [Lachnospiraceae bacterium]|nr:hypothetical protein [Lachnospiraceae bacterium]